MFSGTVRVAIAMVAAAALHLGGYLIDHSSMYSGIILGTLGSFAIGVLAATARQ